MACNTRNAPAASHTVVAEDPLGLLATPVSVRSLDWASFRQRVARLEAALAERSAATDRAPASDRASSGQTGVQVSPAAGPQTSSPGHRRTRSEPSGQRTLEPHPVRVRPNTEGAMPASPLDPAPGTRVVRGIGGFVSDGA